MAANPLEDYAQGIGPGALPQQGSMLPAVNPTPAAPSSLGMPPTAPVSPQVAPGPNFQGLPISAPTQAPLMRFGGQNIGLEQMIQQRLQAIQGVDLAKDYADVPKVSAYGQALHTLPLLQQLANTRSQDRQLQQGYMKEAAAQLEKFNALPPDQQAQMRPFMTSYLRNTAQLANMPLSDQDITHALTSPDMASTYGTVVNDSLVNDQARAGYLSRIGAAKPGKERDDAAALVRKEVDQQAQTMITTYLPQLAASLGATPDKPVDLAQIVALPQVKEQLEKSPTLQRVFNAYVGDKNNADALAGMGIKPGTVSLKAMEAQAQGPTLSAGVQDFLGTLKGPNGQPVTAKTASPEQINWANKAHAQFEIAKAANQGLEVEKFKRTLPAPAELRDQHVDIQALVNTGDIVKPPPGVTVEQLNSGPYRFANPTQQKALMALKPQRTAFSDMNAMADQLIQAKDWKEAVPQGVRLYAGAVSGADPKAAAYLAATNAATSYLARMVESGVMTDQDVLRWKQAATASFFDTKESRAYKIALMGDIMDTAQQSVISQIAGVPMKQPKALQELLGKLDQSTTETWKNSRAGLGPGEKLIKSEGGQIMKLQKGYAVPKGWSEVQ